MGRPKKDTISKSVTLPRDMASRLMEEAKKECRSYSDQIRFYIAKATNKQEVY